MKISISIFTIVSILNLLKSINLSQTLPKLKPEIFKEFIFQQFQKIQKIKLIYPYIIIIDSFGKIGKYSIESQQLIIKYLPLKKQTIGNIQISKNKQFLICSYPQDKILKIYNLNNLQVIKSKKYNISTKILIQQTINNKLLISDKSNSFIYVLNPQTLQIQNFIKSPYQQSLNYKIYLSPTQQFIVEVLQSNKILLLKNNIQNNSLNIINTFQYRPNTGLNWLTINNIIFNSDSSIIYTSDIFGFLRTHSKVDKFKTHQINFFQQLKDKNMIYLQLYQQNPTLLLIGTSRQLSLYSPDNNQIKSLVTFPLSEIGKSNLFYSLNQDKNKIIRINNNKIVIFNFICYNLTYFDQKKLKCLKCSHLCSQCDGSTGQCTTCIDGYTLSKDKCVLCPTGCSTCFGRSCNSCKNKYILSNNNCIIESQLVKTLMALNSVPTLGRVSIFRFQVILLDQIWLYTYDNHTYSQKLSDLFNTIQVIEKNKWSFLQISKNINFSELDLPFNNLQQYSNKKHYQIQQIDDNFLRNAFNYLFFTIPSVFLVYFVFKLLYYLLYEYSISKHLKEYSLWGYFILLILEPNIEYLSYIGFNQLKILISFNYEDKIGNIIAILGFYIVFLYACSSLLLFKIIYGKLTKYLIQKIKINVNTLMIITLILPMRSFIRGGIHSLLYYNFFYQMIALSVLQLTTAITILITIIKCKQNFLNLLFPYFQIIHLCLFMIFDILLLSDHYSIFLSGNNQDAISVMLDDTIMDITQFLFYNSIMKLILIKMPQLYEHFFGGKQQQKENNLEQRKKQQAYKSPRNKKLKNYQYLRRSIMGSIINNSLEDKINQLNIEQINQSPKYRSPKDLKPFKQDKANRLQVIFETQIIFEEVEDQRY